MTTSIPFRECPHCGDPARHIWCTTTTFEFVRFTRWEDDDVTGRTKGSEPTGDDPTYEWSCCGESLTPEELTTFLPNVDDIPVD